MIGVDGLNHFPSTLMLTAGGESSQQMDKSSDTVPAGVTNSYQMETQLRLVVEVLHYFSIYDYRQNTKLLCTYL